MRSNGGIAFELLRFYRLKSKCSGFHATDSNSISERTNAQSYTTFRQVEFI